MGKIEVLFGEFGLTLTLFVIATLFFGAKYSKFSKSNLNLKWIIRPLIGNLLLNHSVKRENYLCHFFLNTETDFSENSDYTN